MLTTRPQMIAAIQAIWPGLIAQSFGPTKIAIPRFAYWMPSKRNVEDFVAGTWKQFIEYIHYDIRLFACTNFAFMFANMIDLHVVNLVKSHVVKYQEMQEWAVFAVWGTKFDGKVLGHAINMIMLEDGELWLFEPQSPLKPMWKADRGYDVIHLAVV